MQQVLRRNSHDDETENIAFSIKPAFQPLIVDVLRQDGCNVMVRDSLRNLNLKKCFIECVNFT